jgi:hypothetical protein
VVTSFFWPGGTVVSAAMTPVIVSVVREALQRPARRIATAGTGRIGETLGLGLREQLGSERGRGIDLKRRLRLPSFKSRPATSDAPYGTVYGRRRVRLKAALITGGLAFVIAAVVLTVPELVFGGSLSGNRSTTFFGGGGGPPPAKQAPQGRGAPSSTPGPSQSAPRGGSSSGQSQEGGGTQDYYGPQGPSGQSSGRGPGQTQSTPQQSQPSQGGRSTQIPTLPSPGPDSSYTP